MNGFLAALAVVGFFVWLMAVTAWAHFAIDEWWQDWWAVPVAVAPMILSLALVVGIIVGVNA